MSPPHDGEHLRIFTVIYAAMYFTKFRAAYAPLMKKLAPCRMFSLYGQTPALLYAHGATQPGQSSHGLALISRRAADCRHGRHSEDETLI